MRGSTQKSWLEDEQVRVRDDLDVRVHFANHAAGVEMKIVSVEGFTPVHVDETVAVRASHFYRVQQTSTSGGNRHAEFKGLTRRVSG